jgi:hypothetical protein
MAALPLAALDPLLAGLCPPWLEPEQEEELEGLQRHLAARADFPGLDCAQCREQEEEGEARPDCAACPLPPPPASAQAALGLLPFLEAPPWLWQDLLGGLFSGLPPAQARLLRLQLLLMTRWRRVPAGSGDCPLFGGRDTF